MKKQLTIAERLMIPGAACHILGNVSVNQPRAAGLKIHESVANIGFTLAKGLHFSTVEDDASLHALQQVIVVARGAILSHHEFASFVGGLHRFFSGLGHSPQL